MKPEKIELFDMYIKSNSKDLNNILEKVVPLFCEARLNDVAWIVNKENVLSNTQKKYIQEIVNQIKNSKINFIYEQRDV